MRAKKDYPQSHGIGQYVFDSTLVEHLDLGCISMGGRGPGPHPKLLDAIGCDLREPDRTRHWDLD